VGFRENSKTHRVLLQGLVAWWENPPNRCIFLPFPHFPPFPLAIHYFIEVAASPPPLLQTSRWLSSPSLPSIIFKRSALPLTCPVEGGRSVWTFRAKYWGEINPEVAEDVMAPDRLKVSPCAPLELSPHHAVSTLNGPSRSRSRSKRSCHGELTSI